MLESKTKTSCGTLHELKGQTPTVCGYKSDQIHDLLLKGSFNANRPLGHRLGDYIYEKINKR